MRLDELFNSILIATAIIFFLSVSYTIVRLTNSQVDIQNHNDATQVVRFKGDFD